jgi:hypothetical protein
MVGREAELEVLCAAFDEAVFQRRAHVVHVVGEAGLGKSRLLAEFQDALNLRICWLLLGRAHPRSAVHPYGLLRDMLARQFQIAEADPAESAHRKLVDGLAPLFAAEGEAPIHLLGHLIGLDFSASPHVQEVLGDERNSRRWRSRRVPSVCAVSRKPTVVVVLDDLHWSDAGTLDFMRHLLAGNGDTPLLSVLMSRPTASDAEAGWKVGEVRHAFLELKPLDKGFSRELAEILLQRLPEVPAALRSLLTAGAEGNPFYMEELVKMLIDDGVIRVEADEWRVLPDKLLEAHVPPTLTGVLQARIDALAPRERRRAAAGRRGRPRVLGPRAGRDRSGRARGAAGAAAQAPRRAPRCAGLRRHQRVRVPAQPAAPGCLRRRPEGAEAPGAWRAPARSGANVPQSTRRRREPRVVPCARRGAVPPLQGRCGRLCRLV